MHQQFYAPIVYHNLNIYKKPQIPLPSDRTLLVMFILGTGGAIENLFTDRNCIFQLIIEIFLMINFLI